MKKPKLFRRIHARVIELIPRRNPIRHQQISTGKGQIIFVEELFKKHGFVFDAKKDRAREKVWMRPEVKPFFIEETNKAVYDGLPNAEALPKVFQSMEIGTVLSFIKKSRGINNDLEARKAAIFLVTEVFKRSKYLAKSNSKLTKLLKRKKISTKYSTYIHNAKDEFGHTIMPPLGYCEIFAQELGIKLE